MAGRQDDSKPRRSPEISSVVEGVFDRAQPKLSSLIEQHHRQVLGPWHMKLRVDCLSRLLPAVATVQLFIGLFSNQPYQISKLDSYYMNFYSAQPDGDGEHSKVNVGYIDDLMLQQDESLWLMFEVRGFNDRRQLLGIAWSICPLYDSGNNLLAGKFALPLYFLEKRRVLGQDHKYRIGSADSRLMVWIAKNTNARFEKLESLTEKEYLPS